MLAGEQRSETMKRKIEPKKDMNAAVVNCHQALLKNMIHNSIVNAVDFIVRKCNKCGNRPQEPDYVAALSLKLTPDLFNILKTIFPRNKFSVTGVFCHQAPLADIGLAKAPEIGDVLFVYAYTDRMGFKKFNSLLFQAKISKKSTLEIDSSEEHQLELYSKWPKFIYKRAGILNGKSIDILPKTINDGAQYLLIDNHPVYGLSGINGTFPMGCATPAKILNINNDLASEITDFIKFKSGRAFEDNLPQLKDDWSKMIWDILRITKDRASKRNNAGISNFPRQIEKLDGCSFFQSESDSIYQDLHEKLKNNENNNDNYFFDDDGNNALSVILIESEEQGEE